jgi:hypothetical protein
VAALMCGIAVEPRDSDVTTCALRDCSGSARSTRERPHHHPIAGACGWAPEAIRLLLPARVHVDRAFPIVRRRCHPAGACSHEFGGDLGPDRVQLIVAGVAAFDVARLHERCPPCTVCPHSWSTAPGPAWMSQMSQRETSPLPGGQVMQCRKLGVDIAASALRPLGQRPAINARAPAPAMPPPSRMRTHHTG